MLEWRLGSGELVVDRPDSHLAQHADVLTILPQVLMNIQSRGRSRIDEEIRFDKYIGTTVCVRTDACDTIVYAQRTGRAGLTRFVKNRVPTFTLYATVILKQHPTDADTYVATTAYIGSHAPYEPWDPSMPEAEMESSRAFWNSHALIWGTQEIVPGTETTECPW